MKKRVCFDIEIREKPPECNPDSIATVYYPDEGSRIEINKGLSRITVTNTIFHEVGHIIDWYLSGGAENQGNNKTREENANIIGNKLNEIFNEENPQRIQGGSYPRRDLRPVVYLQKEP